MSRTVWILLCVSHPIFTSKPFIKLTIGYPRSEMEIRGSTKIHIHTPEEIIKLKTVCRMGREVLDIGGEAVQVGVTTDYIDQVIHKACIGTSHLLNLGTPSHSHRTWMLSKPPQLLHIPEIMLHLRERSNLSRNPRWTHT